MRVAMSDTKSKLSLQVDVDVTVTEVPIKNPTHNSLAAELRKVFVRVFGHDITKWPGWADRETYRLTRKLLGDESPMMCCEEAGALRLEAAKWKDAEGRLSEAYVRLRRILGALRTPYAATPEVVWTHTEQKARELVARADSRLIPCYCERFANGSGVTAEVGIGTADLCATCGGIERSVYRMWARG